MAPKVVLTVPQVLDRDLTEQLTLKPAPLDDADLPRSTVSAQNFLDSARTSVESALSAARQQRAIRLAVEKKAQNGRFSEADQDLLRAALLFAAAGCDSALKRLLRDALAEVVAVNEEAESRLTAFAGEHLVPGPGVVDRQALVRLFLAESPRDALIEAYIRHLTGGSLQSAEKVREVALALGVRDKSFLRRVDPKKSILRTMFVARNEIIHQLDLKEPDTRSRGAQAHKRETRPIDEIRTWATEALGCCQFVVNAVAIQLR
jgi:hypothetical protein